MEKRLAYLEDFDIQQTAKALFFKRVTRLFGDEIEDDEVRNFVYCEGKSASNLPPVRVKTFCYSMRLFSCMCKKDWPKVSSTIDHYRIPVTMGGVKTMFIHSVEEARQLVKVQLGQH